MTPDSGAVFHASIAVPWDRSRPHLSLREGLEQTPFPLAFHRVGSVLDTSRVRCASS